MKLVSDFIPVQAIPAIAPPDVTSFRRDWAARGRPVVLKGVADSWPAVQRWNFEHLRRVAGDVDVGIVWPTPEIYSEDADAHIRALTSYERERSKLSSYLDLLEKDPTTKKYAEAVDIRTVLPQLLDDVCVHDYIPERLLYTMLFWLGPSGTATAPHWDVHHNLLTQIAGRKRVTLYAPEEYRNLYPIEWTAKQFPTTSLVNVRAPDLNRFPRYGSAQAMQATIEPGDALFIPACWWHFVENLEVTIAMNYWWWPPATVLAQPQILRMFTRGIVSRLYQVAKKMLTPTRAPSAA